MDLSGLCAAVGLAKPTVSLAVTRLAEAGLVEKVWDGGRLVVRPAGTTAPRDLATA